MWSKIRRSEPRSEPLSTVAFQWLIPALLVSFLPHIRHLPWWLTGLFVISAATRWYRGPRWQIPRWTWLALFTLLAGGGVALQYGTILGRDAGVALLAAMLALKLLESRRIRDGVVLLMLGYFLVLSNLLYTQSMLTILYVLLSVSALILAQMYLPPQHAQLSGRRAMALCGRIVLQSMPLMLVLFILFPRIPGPLWGLPRDAHSGLTGLSDEMTPGDIGELILSQKIAFRVRFNGAVPPPSQLYWRGPVMPRFDGRSWSTFPERRGDRLQYQFEGNRVSYSVILEPHGRRWLYALDLPASIPEDAAITASFQLRRRRSVTEVIRYEMVSYPQYNTGGLSPGMRHLNLRLPQDGNPRARELAAELFADYPDPAERVNAALRMFRDEPFHYTLSPPVLGRDSVDEFLFDTREGFCEHYASSFTFLMRAAQVPARVVTGYQGGEMNELGDYFMVRQSDAHAWSEVWLEGQGWVRVDPTNAVAPERVEQGLFAALDETASLPILARQDSPWLRNLAMRWDLVNNTWNEWILSYGPERQREFLRHLGFQDVSWSKLLLPMVLSVAMVLGLYLLMHTVGNQQRMRRMLDPLAQGYQRFCRQLGRWGVTRQAHEGPLHFARRAAEQFPTQAREILEISHLYASLRFGGQPQEASLQRFQQQVAGFRIRQQHPQEAPKS